MSEHDLTLWGAGTPRPFRVLWMLEEYGLAYEHRPIQSRSGETYTEDYLALNPKHKIPTFVQGDFVMTESAAILQHIANSFDAPEGFYVPTSATERARLQEWCFFLMVEIDALGAYVIRRHGDLGDIYGHAPNVVQAARDYIADGFNGLLKMWPEDQGFLLAGGFSIPDILLVSMLNYIERQGVVLPDRIAAYAARATARPAYARAFAACYPDRVG